MLVIGLTGTKSGGKGEIAAYLKSRGFLSLSLSDMVREEAVRRGISDYSIKDLQDIGNDLREKEGPGVLAKMASQKIDLDCVIDGIRNPGEADEPEKIKKFPSDLSGCAPEAEV